MDLGRTILSSIVILFVLGWLYDKPHGKYFNHKEKDFLCKKYKLFPGISVSIFMIAGFSAVVVSIVKSHGITSQFLRLISILPISTLAVFIMANSILCSIVRGWRTDEFYKVISYELRISSEKLRYIAYAVVVGSVVCQICYFSA